MNVCEIFDMNNASRKKSKNDSTTPALTIRKRKTNTISFNNNNNRLLTNYNLNEINNNKFPLMAEDSGFSESFGYFF